MDSYFAVTKHFFLAEIWELGYGPASGRTRSLIATRGDGFADIIRPSMSPVNCAESCNLPLAALADHLTRSRRCVMLLLNIVHQPAARKPAEHYLGFVSFLFRHGES